VCTLVELLKIGAVASVDFGRGILDANGGKRMGAHGIIDKKVAKRIQYIFASGETNSKNAKHDGSKSLVIKNAIAVQQAAGTSIGDRSFKARDSSSKSKTANEGADSAAENSASSDLFTVTSVFDGDYVINSFGLSTDELVSLDKSSLLEFRPTGSSTTFFVPQLLSLMKELQLRELLKKLK
jgi:hypothetical protein